MAPEFLLTFLQRVSSNESQVVLDAVTMATSGKYSCEVSADAPSFHTLIAAAELEVIGKWKMHSRENKLRNISAYIVEGAIWIWWNSLKRLHGIDKPRNFKL